MVTATIERWARRAGKLAALVEHLARGGTEEDDPLPEDPYCILTEREMASLRARREEVSDGRARADLALLIATVDRLGRRLARTHEALSLAYRQAMREDTPQSLFALSERVAEVVHDLETGAEVVLPPPASISTWLALPWDRPLPFPPDSNPLADVAAPKALHVLAALVGMNGGIEAKLVEPAPGGPYGRLGLYPLETSVLVELANFCNGWISATREDASVFYRLIAEEVARVAAARRAASAGQGVVQLLAMPPAAPSSASDPTV